MPVLSTTDNSRTLRIGVLATIGTIDPREMGDTITGLVLGQIFQMAYRVTRPYLPKPLASAKEIARQLGAYGIDVQLIQARSTAEAFQHLAMGEYDMGLGGWVADNPDPTEFYESLLSSA